MRRLITLFLLALVACTPTQMRRWQSFHDRRPAAAVAWLDWKAEQPGRALAWLEAHYAPKPIPAPQTRLAGMQSCGQWADEAWTAGWRSEGYTLGWVMYRESNCQAAAYNPSGARGLMQVLGMWADDCGGWPDRLFEPVFNLRCALHVKAVQGWGAWSVY